MSTATGKISKIGAYTVCLTEMWERFGFYTVVSLLVLYMTKNYHYSDTEAYGIYAAYTALLYITPAIGGYISDHYLGYHRSLISGLTLMISGYGLLALPAEQTFYPGLALIIIGMGFFKSMPYAIMGRVYKDDQSQLDAGCTLYYLAIQVGGIVPIALGGFLARHFGWHFTFLIATIGMSIGAIIFLSFHHRFKHADNTIGLLPFNFKLTPILIVGCTFAAAFFTFLLNHLTLARWIVISGGVIAVFYVLIYSFRKLNKVDRNRVFAAIILSSVGIIFQMLYLQETSSMTLYIDRHVDREFLGFVIPASAYFLFNPFWIFIIAPALSAFYTYRSKTNSDFSIAGKFAIGIICMGIGYAILGASGSFYSHHYEVSTLWILFSYAFQSTSELMVNALGPAMILQFVPRQLTGIMMGVWFLSSALGSLLAGFLANMTAIPESITRGTESIQIYSHAFSMFAVISCALGLLYLCAVPFIKKMGAVSAPGSAKKVGSGP